MPDVIISRRNHRGGLATAVIQGMSTLGTNWLNTNLMGVKNGIVVVSDEGIEDLVILMSKEDLDVEFR